MAGYLPQTSFKNLRALLRIWREAKGQPGTFMTTGNTIVLGQCSDVMRPDDSSNVFECNLSTSEQVEVEVGDIVGLQLQRNSSRRAFKLFFNRTDGPLNYEFTSNNVTLALSDATVIDRALPLLTLTVATETNSTSTTTNTADGTTATLVTTTKDFETTELPNTTDILPSQTTSERTSTPMLLTTAAVTVTDQSNTTNNETAASFNFNTAGITMIAIFVGLGLMPCIIIILTLALVCSIRKNRKLKRKMTQKELGDAHFTNSTEMILRSESRDEDTHYAPIQMEENIAYTNRRRKSDDNDYVINQLVYASIEECDQPQFNVGSPNAYEDISEPTAANESFS